MAHSEYIEDIEREEIARRQRIRIANILIMALVGSISLILAVYLSGDFALNFPFLLGLYNFRIPFAVLSLLSLGAAGYSFLMMYLQTGFQSFETADTVRSEQRRDIEILLSEVRQGLNRVSHLEERFSNIDNLTKEISESERDEFVRRLRESIEKTAKEQYIDQIRESVSQSQSSLELVEGIQKNFTTTTERLEEELTAVTRRGNINLTLGILTALAGIIALTFFVWNLIGQPSSDNLLTFTERFVPRISLVILIEVFAYFFLKLYSNSLAEIKYFQNELTNVEAKYLALHTALYSKDNGSLGDIVSQIVRTERNYVLEKGQTTVDLERSKIEKKSILSMNKKLLKSLKR